MLLTAEAERTLDTLRRRDVRRHRRLAKALALLEQDPSYPSLVTHRFEGVEGPGGEPVWESYVENRTPSAWRIWWFYGPDSGEITVVAIGPHP